MVVDVVIRQARHEDADGIASLWAALVAYHHALDPALPPARLDGPRHYARAIHDRLESPTTAVWVAEAGEALVGYGVAVVNDAASAFFAFEKAGLISDLYVSPAHRRSGIGRRLVDALTCWFAEQGVHDFEWNVAARNTEAQAFWAAMRGVPVLIRMRATWPPEAT